MRKHVIVATQKDWTTLESFLEIDFVKQFAETFSAKDLLVGSGWHAYHYHMITDYTNSN